MRAFLKCYRAYVASGKRAARRAAVQERRHVGAPPELRRVAQRAFLLVRGDTPPSEDAVASGTAEGEGE
eukprot:7094303-Alexandrium_andersonii.AAC.1